MGLACLAALTLRSPENSKAFYEAGIAEVTVGCMKAHPDDANVQVTKLLIQLNLDITILD